MWSQPCRSLSTQWQTSPCRTNWHKGKVTLISFIISRILPHQPQSRSVCHWSPVSFIQCLLIIDRWSDYPLSFTQEKSVLQWRVTTGWTVQWIVCNQRAHPSHEVFIRNLNNSIVNYDGEQFLRSTLESLHVYILGSSWTTSCLSTGWIIPTAWNFGSFPDRSVKLNNLSHILLL